jgi:hypothetical protein
MRSPQQTFNSSGTTSPYWTRQPEKTRRFDGWFIVRIFLAQYVSVSPIF